MAVFALSACSDFARTSESVIGAQAEAEHALRQIEPSKVIAQPLSIDKRPYYGSQAIPITNGAPLPTQLEQADSVVMTFARPVTLSELTRMIQSVTGVHTVKDKGSEDGASAGMETAEQTFMPADGERMSGGRVVWQGALSNLLRQAADAFEADWSYDGDTISISQQITRTYVLNALASDLQMTGSVQTATASDGGSLPTVDVTSSTNMKLWDEIEEAIKSIVGSDSRVAYSPSSGTITVTGTPNIVRRVGRYLNLQNAMRLRRVAIAVKILSVSADDSLELASDVTGLIKKAFDQASLRSVGESTGGIALGILKAPDSTSAFGTDADMTAIDSDRLVSKLKASKYVKDAAVVHSGALITLSDQPAPLQVGRQIAYIERVSASTGDSGGSSSIEPGTLNTGLTMTVLPRIVEANRILMRLSLSITSAETPFRSFETEDGSLKIELPEVDTTGFLQNAVLTSGETMVLAGFEKNDAGVEKYGPDNGLWVLGGSRSNSKAREITVMMLTAQILPEDPITVIGGQ